MCAVQYIDDEINLYTASQAFLAKIAEEMGHDLEQLSLKVELRSGGPTVRPRSSVDSQHVVSTTVLNPDNRYGPSADYDSLGSKHIQYTIELTSQKGKITIPRAIYSWQLHPLPGCCRFAVNRWVVLNEEWSKKLQKEALKLRCTIARNASYKVLYVSSGRSFVGAELYGEFTQVWKAKDGQALYAKDI